MPPIPCMHCGNNFMRHTNDPEAAKLCNNCSVRENIRNPKGKEKMEMITIQIECPRQIQIEIEEICINKGVNFSEYFLDLHEQCTREIHSVEKLFAPEGFIESESKKSKSKKEK